ncbi:putative chaperonin GroES [Candidatus Zinderia insecticola CARI]|uniref:Co-chaperonin GroES n=1 Tax=Zinderia insecticola (strain CARI) TaxID=871271 RepID=E0TIM4_ZINIC|nr:putative chaperonin GroES [Candidatus Zinderia insecticola CARI]
MKNFENIIPINDKIIIECINKNKKTSSGIVLPENSSNKTNKGKVIAVGNGILNKSGKLIPLTVKKNDFVLFGKYSGQKIKLNKKKYLVMREEDIYAIIK